MFIYQMGKMLIGATCTCVGGFQYFMVQGACDVEDFCIVELRALGGIDCTYICGRTEIVAACDFTRNQAKSKQISAAETPIAKP